ncbi:DNA alkylation repair protein [Microbacterium aurantiacum]|uniref:DNA alkylation repair protein n=1 Tax=Microbacterium aurantiacum TaxID=162393 RepID=A0A0M9VLP3_9MICO|nr:DNA alkylation repair protein [Microbacterium chocolatum]ANG85658.1 DNA alkylation repair protein [Microbacterium chocolatum]KOS11402.1 DNA alkylation repair protein [Microbacterium chocolatum]
MESDGLVREIRDALRARADPERALAQQAYMKSALPFYGVRLPEVRAVARSAARSYEIPVAAEAASVLWDTVTHREEWYAAMALRGLAGLRRAPDTLEVVTAMVRSGRWWDITDELSHRVADMLDADAVTTARVVRAWSVDEDLWMRRLAIISQLGRKERTDRALLADVIEPNRGDAEFFVAKAIGWALRDYARSDPDWVRAYLDSHDLRVLSRREATRHLI